MMRIIVDEMPKYVEFCPYSIDRGDWWGCTYRSIVCPISKGKECPYFMSFREYIRGKKDD